MCLIDYLQDVHYRVFYNAKNIKNNLLTQIRDWVNKLQFIMKFNAVIKHGTVIFKHIE
jgi:hypothetical protein